MEDRSSEVPQIRFLWGFKTMAFSILLTAVIPSLFLGGPSKPQTFTIFGVALAGVLLAEWSIERLSPRQAPPSSPSQSQRVLLISSLATFAACTGYALSAVFGFGSIAEVALEYSYSPLASVANGLKALNGVAMTLVALLRLLRAISARHYWFSSLLIIAFASVSSLLNGYLGGVAVPLLTFAIVGTLTRAMKWRWVVAGVLCVAMLMPALFVLRDNVRVEQGMERSSLAVGPFERLRSDTTVALIDQALPAADVGMPSTWLLLRTALVPRVLDPGRPLIEMGRLMNTALGFNTANNVSFGTYGTAYWIGGLPAVAASAISLGALFGIGVRYFTSVLGASLLGTVAPLMARQEATFPTFFSGIAQTMLTVLLLMAIARLIEVFFCPRRRQVKVILPRSGIG